MSEETASEEATAEEAGREDSRMVGLPRRSWGAGQAIAGLLVAFGVLFVGTLIVALFDPALETTAGRDSAQLVVAAALGGTALGLAAHYSRGRLAGALGELGLTGFAWRAAGIAVLGWLAYLVIAALLAPVLEPEQQDVTRDLGVDEDSAVLLVIAGLLIVVAAPLSEELFFRGYMFAGLRRSLPLWPAAAIQAAIWGSLHLSGGNIGVAVQLSVFGLVLAWLYERTGTLWAPILAHGVNNSLAFVLLVTDVI